MAERAQVVSTTYAVAVVVAVFSVVMTPVLAWGVPIQPMFLIAWIIAIPLCMKTGTAYEALQQGMVQFCAKAIIPIMILFCVGGLMATWNAAGTVPMIISYGVKYISPRFFLVAAFLLCAGCSLTIGTAWGTCGTVGVALSVVGFSLQINPALTAGAVCSGSFIGDAISPLSAGPSVCKGITGVEVFPGLRHQAKVVVPSACLCTAVYLVQGLWLYRGLFADRTLAQSIAAAMENTYRFGFLAMLPMLLVIVLLLTKRPSIPSLLAGGIAGGFVACLYQGSTPAQALNWFWSGYTADTGMELTDTLLNRGGITSMSATAVMFLFAFGLFGMLSAAGIIDALVRPLVKRVHDEKGAVLLTLLMALIGNGLSTSANFSFVFTGNVMMPVYQNVRIDKRNLTRAMAVGCTIMCTLLPWNMNAVIVADFMGVSPVQMLPYNYFALFTPVLLVVLTMAASHTKRQIVKQQTA